MLLLSLGAHLGPLRALRLKKKRRGSFGLLSGGGDRHDLAVSRRRWALFGQQGTRRGLRLLRLLLPLVVLVVLHLLLPLRGRHHLLLLFPIRGVESHRGGKYRTPPRRDARNVGDMPGRPGGCRSHPRNEASVRSSPLSSSFSSGGREKPHHGGARGSWSGISKNFLCRFPLGEAHVRRRTGCCVGRGGISGESVTSGGVGCGKVWCGVGFSWVFAGCRSNDNQNRWVGLV